MKYKVNNRKLAVVVPMYNEALNLGSCVQSLMSQENQDFDVIFVDDGSTDLTSVLLKALLDKKQPSFRYKILYQENGGAAKARELALNNTDAPYIMSLDADDIYSSDMTCEVISAIERNHQPDIILPDMEFQNKKGEYNRFEFYSEQQRLAPRDCLVNTLGDWKVHGCMCIKTEVMRVSYEQYYKYNQERTNYLNNDEIISRMNFYNASSVVRCSGIYYYRYNQLSTTKSINPKRYARCKNAVILYQLLDRGDAEINQGVEQELFDTIRHTRRYLKMHKKELSNVAIWKQTIRHTISYALKIKPTYLSRKQRFNLRRYYWTL